MKTKFGIRKTKANIILLFVLGLVIGAVLGLRQGEGFDASQAESASEALVPVVMNGGADAS